MTSQAAGFVSRAPVQSSEKRAAPRRHVSRRHFVCGACTLRETRPCPARRFGYPRSQEQETSPLRGHSAAASVQGGRQRQKKQRRGTRNDETSDTKAGVQLQAPWGLGFGAMSLDKRRKTAASLLGLPLRRSANVGQLCCVALIFHAAQLGRALTSADAHFRQNAKYRAECAEKCGRHARRHAGARRNPHALAGACRRLADSNAAGAPEESSGRQRAPTGVLRRRIAKPALGRKGCPKDSWLLVVFSEA